MSTYTCANPGALRFMIDEELYQQASEELNSDRRRPHLWARACALASDDHDEARYLYTNLRVEELIAERDRGVPGDARRATEFESKRLELAPAGESVNGGAGIPASQRDSVDASLANSLDKHDFVDLVPLDEPDDRPSSVRTETRLDGVSLDDIDLDADELAALNDLQRAPTAQDVAITRGHSPGPASDLTDSADGASGADGADVASGKDGAGIADAIGDMNAIGAMDATGVTDAAEPWTDPAQDAGGSLAARIAEFEEANPVDDAPVSSGSGDLPVLKRDVTGGTPDHVDQADSAADRLEGSPAALAARRAYSPELRDDYADSRDLDELLDDDQDPAPIVELDGRGRVWAVYETGEGKLKALRRGVSWVAMLLTLPWLLLRGLFGTALFYVLLWCVALGGALLTGLAWLDAGAAATATGADGGLPVLPIACIGFIVIATIGLVLLPFFRANHWRESAWQRRGYALRGELRARTSNEALHRVRAEGLSQHA